MFYISKQSSGGRGEYELAGNQDGLNAQDVQGRYLELWCGNTLGTYRQTGIHLVRQGGKNRLRTDSLFHLHRQIEALLLMPKSTRAESQVHDGQALIALNQYVVDKIELDHVEPLDPDILKIKVGDLYLTSGRLVGQVNFSARMDRIMRVHSSANLLPPPLAELINQHRAIATSTDILTSDIDRFIVRKIMKLIEAFREDYECDYAYGSDPLPALESMIQLFVPQAPLPVDEMVQETVPIRQREIQNWRNHVATRGAASARFRKQVQKSYNFTCIVCGIQLPKTTFNLQPGVDAAHILPWASFDLDVVSNGLCLCKTHHWAFDQFVILIEYQNPNYIIRVNPDALAALATIPSTATKFLSEAGPIPFGRLPRDPQERPNPQFLKELYDQAGIPTNFIF